MEQQESNKEIKGYTGSQKQVQGFAILPIQIGSKCYPHRFYIVDTKDEQYQILLGQPWQKKYNAQIDWSKNEVYGFNT